MYIESITFIDEGDTIAFIDDLQFEYEGVHEISFTDALSIDWLKVNNAQISGARYLFNVTHVMTNYTTTYGGPITEKVIVFED